jgi:hypothetical protein
MTEQEAIKAHIDDYQEQLAAMIADEKPLTNEAARRHLDDALELQSRLMPFADWCAAVRPDVAAYAVKAYGSLEAFYEDSRLKMCETIAMASDQLQALERAGKVREGK